jgi:hypothetical protein
MQNEKKQLDIVSALSGAIERTKTILFCPFDLLKWFLIGFAAWLANLGGGVGGSFNFNFPSGKPENADKLISTVKNHFSGSFSEIFSRTLEIKYITTIALIVLAVIALSIILVLIMTWVKSRGEFIFIDNISNNRPGIITPWKKYLHEGNSLFLFRLCIAALSFLLVLILIASIILYVISVKKTALVLLLILLCVVIFLLPLAAITLFSFYVNEICIPVMFAENCGCIKALAIFRGIFFENKAVMLLYLIVKIALSLAIAFAVISLTLLLCCCCCCLWFLISLPYLWAVALLPVLIFNRAFSMEFLAQLKPEYKKALFPLNSWTY